MWALQVQFLLQIIVNRICILLPGPSQRVSLFYLLKYALIRANLLYAVLAKVHHRRLDHWHQPFRVLHLDTSKTTDLDKVP
jgi:hypothetical protein